MKTTILKLATNIDRGWRDDDDRPIYVDEADIMEWVNDLDLPPGLYANDGTNHALIGPNDRIDEDDRHVLDAARIIVRRSLV